MNECTQIVDEQTKSKATDSHDENILNIPLKNLYNLIEQERFYEQEPRFTLII